MASPFKVFRKNQKLLIVIFGIALMVSFLVVGSISQFIMGGGAGGGGQYQGANDPVFTWKGGTVNEAELARMRHANSVAARFTNDVYAKAVDLGGLPQAEPIPYAAAEGNLVYTMLLAQKAEELGVVVDNAAISMYLNELGDGRVDPQMRYELFNKIPGESGSQSALMEQLRVELMARQMEMLAHAGFAAMSGPNMRNRSPWEFHSTPIDTWESYNNLFRQVRADLYPVAVADFVDDVEDPSDATLREFYQEHKAEMSSPASPDPGFLKPERSKFAYVRAEYDTFLEQEKQKVTDEQVKAYYEEHKEDFLAPELPPEEEETPSNSADEPKGEENNGEPKDNDDAPAPPSDTPDEGGNNGGEEKEKGSAPDEGQADPEKNRADDSAKTPDDAKKQDSEPSPKPEGAAKTGASDNRVAFEPAVLTALHAVAQADGADDKKSVSEGSEDASKKQENQADSKPGEGANPAANDDPSGSEEPDSNQPPAKGAEKTPSAEKTDGGDANDDAKKDDIPDPPEPKYLPLEEVEDLIREELADKNAARAQMFDAIDQASDALSKYQRAFNLWRDEHKDESLSNAPQAPSPADLAKGRLLSGGTTELMDIFAAQKSPLGDLSQQLSQGQQQSFLEMFYSPRTPRELYRGRMLSIPNAQAPNDVYLIWRIEFEKEEVPEFDAIRDVVLKAWKMEQARPLAEKRAVELAEKARQHPNESLEQSLGKGAVTTDMFSRMSGMSGPTVSVTGVEYTGNDFLNAVFSLEVGQVTTAMDAPKTHAYVIRLVEESQSVQQRLDQYLMFASNALMLGGGGQIYSDWVSDLEKEMGFEWERDPRRFEM